jgi:hypothetical protein
MESPAEERGSAKTGTGNDLEREENKKNNTGVIMKAEDWKWAQSHFPVMSN